MGVMENDKFWHQRERELIARNNDLLEQKRGLEAQLGDIGRYTESQKLVALAVLHELEKAQRKHAPMHSAHEGYAVILEELNELWDEIKKREPSRPAMAAECVQVAAMAMRFLMDVLP